MNAAQMIAFTFEMSDGLVKRALKGLTDADLMKRPSDQDNPIGWLMWHKTRVEDCAMAAVAGEEQAWIAEKWHEKFDMAPEPKQIGFGDSLEQVMRLKITKADVIGYANAVRARTLPTLESLSAEDLEREMTDIGGNTIKTGEYLGRVASDYHQHCGQICYLRGFITGFGWAF